MKKRETKTDFNAVEFMRKRRDELSDLYYNDANEFKRKLNEVRGKYKNKFHVKEKILVGR